MEFIKFVAALCLVLLQIAVVVGWAYIVLHFVVKFW